VTDIRIEYEWQDPGTARGPELRATWARISIRIGDQCVTQVLDQTSRSVRDGIYGPLYPLAEWLLFNWWAIFEECGDRNRQNHTAYRGRHDLRGAMEGYALPDLLLIPAGRLMHLHWNQCVDSARRVEFLQHGSEFVLRENVEESFLQLLQSVVERLEQQGVVESPLQQEWKAMASLKIPDQHQCRLIGALGVDPFDLSVEHESAIRTATQSLPINLQEEFFKTAQVDQLLTQLQWVQHGLQEAEKTHLPLCALSADPAMLNQANSNSLLPWQTGYRYAQQVRASLKLPINGERLELSAMCGGDVPSSPITESAPRPFHGLVTIRADRSFGFFIPRKRPESFRFAFCRGLCEYLLSRTGEAALLTAAESERQARNRAFAAELLAPADAIKNHLHDSVVTTEDIEDLAQHFEVSSFVIEHQIKNHRLAEIVGI
jgi:IrrE N-terminal-like domain